MPSAFIGGFTVIKKYYQAVKKVSNGFFSLINKSSRSHNLYLRTQVDAGDITY